MNKKVFIAIVAGLLAGTFFLPLAAIQRTENNPLSSVDTADALMLARYYVGLLPVTPNGEAKNPVSGTRVLTIELAGRNTLVSSLDTLYIMPPGQAVSENTTFTFDAGTQVKLYFVHTTPAPVIDPKFAPAKYQTASFIGFGGTNMDIIMNSDKTIRIGYSMTVAAYALREEPGIIEAEVANAE
jgi:hypothetical protein